MTPPYVEYPYATSTPSHPDLAKNVIDAVRRCGNIRSVCELGCGGGWVSNRLAEDGYEVIAVDASESGILAAREANGQATFYRDLIDRGLASRLGKRFDLVLSSEVIEHLYRPADLLEAARELLNSGGLLVLSTPYHGYLKYLALAVLGKMDKHLTVNWEGGHIKFFSPATLSELLDSQGFRVVRFAFSGRFRYFWKSMICVAEKR
ncbi:MAG: methyltransferase domain-containing protein [Gammaproteobacteria bacterium]